MEVKNVVEKTKQNIDTKFIVSGIVLAILLGLLAYGFREMGMSQAAKIVGGK